MTSPPVATTLEEYIRPEIVQKVDPVAEVVPKSEGSLSDRSPSGECLSERSRSKGRLDNRNPLKGCLSDRSPSEGCLSEINPSEYASVNKPFRRRSQ